MEASGVNERNACSSSVRNFTRHMGGVVVALFDLWKCKPQKMLLQNKQIAFRTCKKEIIIIIEKPGRLEWMPPPLLLLCLTMFYSFMVLIYSLVSDW